MKIKVSEATPLQLNYLVAKCEGMTIEIRPAGACGRPLYVLAAEAGSTPWTWEPSTSWHHGGPIIEREKLELRPGLYHSNVWACWGQSHHGERLSQQGKTGPTPLIAAMRCYVASQLGDVVEIPEELK